MFKKKKSTDALRDFFIRTPGDPGRLPADLSPASHQDDRPAVKSSNLILTTWCDAQTCEVFGEGKKNQTAQAFLQEFAPMRNRLRSCFSITLGRSQIPCEIPRRRSQSHFVGVSERPWMGLSLVAHNQGINWRHDNTGSQFAFFNSPIELSPGLRLDVSSFDLH